MPLSELGVSREGVADSDGPAASAAVVASGWVAVEESTVCREVFADIVDAVETFLGAATRGSGLTSFEVVAVTAAVVEVAGSKGLMAVVSRTLSCAAT